MSRVFIKKTRPPSAQVLRVKIGIAAHYNCANGSYCTSPADLISNLLTCPGSERACATAASYALVDWAVPAGPPKIQVCSESLRTSRPAMISYQLDIFRASVAMGRAAVDQAGGHEYLLLSRSTQAPGVKLCLCGHGKGRRDRNQQNIQVLFECPFVTPARPAVTRVGGLKDLVTESS